ncbi:MAG: hypothetical protein ABR600_13955 [Actinomycetota bacterium]
MLTLLQRHASTVVVAFVTAAVTAAAPAIAANVTNADKVDGFDAVSCKASVANRDRVLVATCPNGYLPDNAIKKVGDADQLDGIDSTGFYQAGSTVANAERVGGFSPDRLTRVGYAASASSRTLVGKSGSVISASIRAPGPGFLVIHASSDTYNQKIRDLLACALAVDGDEVSSTRRWFVVNGVNSDDDCATDGVVPVTKEGEHTVELTAVAVDSKKTTFGRTVLWAFFVPFDGNGEPPHA